MARNYYLRMFICVALVLFLFANIVVAAETPGITRSRVTALRVIEPEQAITHLESLQLATVSKLPGTPSILITGSHEKLEIASAIIDMLDRPEKYQLYQIDTIVDLSRAKPAHIRRAIKGLNISDSTDITQSTQAMVEVIDGNVIIIGTPNVNERIANIIKNEISEPQPRNTSDANSLPRAADTNEADEDLFDSLLGTVEQTTQMSSALRKPDPEEKTTTEAVGKDNEDDALKQFLTTLNTDSADKAGDYEEIKQKPADAGNNREEKKTETVAQNLPDQKMPGQFDKDEILQIDLPEQLPLVELLRMVGEYLNLDYMYEPEEVKGNVTLKLRDGWIRAGELYPMLEQVMMAKDLIMSRKGNLVIIMPKDKALDIDPTFSVDGKDVQVGEVVITRIFNLDHVDVNSAKNLLERMRLGINIEPIAETGTLIVTGFSNRMPRIEAMMEMIDRPGPPKKFKFRQLEHTMAETLAPQIKSLVEQMGGISITIAEPAATPQASAGPRATAQQRAAQRAAQQRAADARTAQQPGEPAQDSVYLDADPRTNRLLMIGYESDLATVDEFVDSLDVEKRDLRSLRLYEIQHVEAEDVLTKLSDLKIVKSQNTQQQQQRSFNRPTQQDPQRPVPVTAGVVEHHSETPDDQPQVVIVHSSNALLANATPEQHLQIAQIIGFVDTKNLRRTLPYEVYQLQNQDPTDLRAVLLDLIKETISESAIRADDADNKVRATPGSSGSSNRKIEDNITIVADVPTNSLVVYANQTNQAMVASLIETLDQYRPQVLLDVTLVEISKNDIFEYDLDILAKFPQAGVAPQVIKNALFPESDTNPPPPFLGTFPERTYELGSRGGRGMFFYGDNHIQALFSAMNEKGYGRVMAKPKLLVNDNQEGVIQTSETTYVTRTKSTIIGVGQDDRPIVSEEVSFDPYDSGIMLSIKPHISKGNNLRLNITLDRSDFRRVTDNQGRPPDILSSTVDSVVTVPDGSTIILGGMERLSQTKSGTKVPILGDIPILGGLFRSTRNSDQQSRLYIFVKAQILRPSNELGELGDIERASDRNVATFEKYEAEMQEYQDWPGIDAKPMDPINVLRAD